MKIQYFLYSILLSFLFYACDGMYDNVNPYYDRGETNYLAKVDTVFTKSGKNRVQFTWRVNPDPRIRELYVSWNTGANEATIPIDFNKLDDDRYYSVILDQVEEGSYIFSLHHTGKGHMSIATEAEATSYGEQYQASLKPRSIRSITMRNGKATITWRTIVENCEVKITYTNVEGITSERSVISTEINTVIEDVLPNSPFSYVSTYLPEEDAIDSFSVTSETLYFPE